MVRRMSRRQLAAERRRSDLNFIVALSQMHSVNPKIRTQSDQMHSVNPHAADVSVDHYEAQEKKSSKKEGSYNRPTYRCQREKERLHAPPPREDHVVRAEDKEFRKSSKLPDGEYREATSPISSLLSISIKRASVNDEDHVF